MRYLLKSSLMPLSVLTISFSHSCSVLSLSVSGGWAMIGSPFPPSPPRRRTSASIIWTSPVDLKINALMEAHPIIPASASESQQHGKSFYAGLCTFTLSQRSPSAFICALQSLNSSEIYKHMKNYFCRYIWPSNHFFFFPQRNSNMNIQNVNPLVLHCKYFPLINYHVPDSLLD